MEFVRFGGLSSVNQKGYDPTMPGMHSPPMRKGLYAFPLGCIVPFMLGGDRPTAKGKARYVRDKDGNKIDFERDTDLYTNKKAKPYVVGSKEYYPDRNFYKVFSTEKARDGKHYWMRPAKMKKFDYEGEIWHHLGHNLKRSQILSQKGMWFLSDIHYYEKAFKKESLNLRHESASNSRKGDVGSVRGKFGDYCIDHLEVFIEKI